MTIANERSRREFQLANDGRALFELGKSAGFSARGGDAARYLHGRLTQDIKSLAVGSTAVSLLLSPQGKLEGMVALRRNSEDFTLIPLPPSTAEFQAELLRFKVSDDVELRPQADMRLFALPNRPQGLPPAEGSCLAADLAGFKGKLMAIAEAQLPEALSELEAAGIILASPETFTAYRAAVGYPLFGVDFDRATPISHLNAANFISFSKGCYTGQEVVETVSARGKAAKAFIAFSARMEAAPDRPELLERRDADADAVPAGTITTWAFLPWEQRVCGIALVKSECRSEALTLSGTEVTTRDAAP